MSFAHILSLLEYLIQFKLTSLDDYEWLIMFKYKLEYEEETYKKIFPKRMNSKKKPILTFKRLETDCSQRHEDFED